jgi:hypothetical protein
MEPKRYMITWNDTPGIDGDFIFVVHPEQLFLRSGHDNPNPNYVYWVQQLSEAQYRQLVKFLDTYDGQLFRRNRWNQWPGYSLFILKSPRISPEPPDRMTPEVELAWQSKFNAAVNSNLRRILKELNRRLSHGRTLRTPTGRRDQYLSQPRDNRTIGRTWLPQEGTRPQGNGD